MACNSVAPRTGGVDMSPPARGAWIEMVVIALFSAKVECRPPHGGRGLKSFHRDVNLFHHKSPPARGAWIEIHQYGKRGVAGK